VVPPPILQRRSFALPRPAAAGALLCTPGHEPIKPAHKKLIIPADMKILISGRLANPGWGYTDFHASVNIVFIAFYEVRVLGILRSSRRAEVDGIILTVGHRPGC
jgi:hypothetical protein